MTLPVLRQSSHLLIGAVALLALAAACGDDNDSASITSVEVQVEVLEADAPVSVEATDVSPVEGGEVQHGVRVTWQGEERATLDDARFTHHEQSTTGEGDLITVGRGCSAAWDEEPGRAIQICTDDLQIIELDPGDTHEYPVTVVFEVGPLALVPGTYVVDEVIGWSHGTLEEPSDLPAQSFTVRLTYTVE